MKKTFTLFALFWSAVTLSAQALYTEKQYGWRIEKDLEYGVAVNYSNIPTALILDLYKPVGDNNPHRPLLVLVHGGSWLGGCKDDPNSGIVAIAKEMAQRGYAVASVNYRLGWHKDDYVPAAIPPDINPLGSCLYAADSSELIRAIYRGQQDVKGAIRWLKARASMDSTSANAVLVGGESAGAFIAMAVGFLDRPEEKPFSCDLLPTAPVPASNVQNCYSLNCIAQTITPTGAALERPDLGPVGGTLNLNGQSDNVVGVASFFGGVPYEAAPKDWLQGPDTPAVYFYHQTCDGIVPFGAGIPMFAISNYCNLGFTPWHLNYPITYGNGSIAALFEASPNPPIFTTDFEQCPPFNPDIAFFECLRYGQNGSYHFIQNPPLRAQKMADFFCPIVTAALGTTGCTVNSEEPAPSEWSRAKVSPNPFGQMLSVFIAEALEGEASIALTDISGKTVWSAVRILNAGENVLFEQNHLPAGFYALQIRSKAGVGIWKVVRRQ